MLGDLRSGNVFIDLTCYLDSVNVLLEKKIRPSAVRRRRGKKAPLCKHTWRIQRISVVQGSSFSPLQNIVFR